MKVTVARTEPKGSRTACGMRYVITSDATPDEAFEPRGYAETCQSLTVSAALDLGDAQALVRDAWTLGVASRVAGGDE